jgi:hypothetical protein
MSATGLLEELRILGVLVVPEGDRLRIEAPTAVMTPKLRRSLADHKPELLALLGAPQHPTTTITPNDLPSDWRVEFEERAAIREYEGRQAREHAEAEALREVVARMRAEGREREV